MLIAVCVCEWNAILMKMITPKRGSQREWTIIRQKINDIVNYLKESR